jgi:hypothetical protein
MKLLRATFLSIRGLPDATCDFGDAHRGVPHDVVVITGPPASGKTRMLEALLAAKDVIAPYGPMISGAPWITGGASAAKIELAFVLDAEEQKRAGVTAPVVQAEALFSPRVCRGEADEGLIALLQSYEHTPRSGKVDYFPANRALVSSGSMHGLSAIEQRTLRTTRDPRKYSFVPRLLFALTWDGAYGAARERFESAVASLSPTVRYLGPNPADPSVCFSSCGGPRVAPSALSGSESEAVLVAATATLLHFERSLVLIDRPEISADEGAIVAWLQAVRALAGDLQLLVASSSPALLAAVDPQAVVTLHAR